MQHAPSGNIRHVLCNVRSMRRELSDGATAALPAGVTAATRPCTSHSANLWDKRRCPAKPSLTCMLKMEAFYIICMRSIKAHTTHHNVQLLHVRNPICIARWQRRALVLRQVRRSRRRADAQRQIQSRDRCDGSCRRALSSITLHSRRAAGWCCIGGLRSIILHYLRCWHSVRRGAAACGAFVHGLHHLREMILCRQTRLDGCLATTNAYP